MLLLLISMYHFLNLSSISLMIICCVTFFKCRCASSLFALLLLCCLFANSVLLLFLFIYVAFHTLQLLMFSESEEGSLLSLLPSSCCAELGECLQGVMRSESRCQISALYSHNKSLSCLLANWTTHICHLNAVTPWYIVVCRALCCNSYVF